jgi:hypothetical protein
MLWFTRELESGLVPADFHESSLFQDSQFDSAQIRAYSERFSLELGITVDYRCNVFDPVYEIVDSGPFVWSMRMAER